MAVAQRKTELDEALDDIGKIQVILEAAYDPQSCREDFAKAISDALEICQEYPDDEDDVDDDAETDEV